MLLSVQDIFMLLTVQDIFMLLTVHDVYMLLTVHDPSISVRQQLNRWVILHYVDIVKGEYRLHCTRCNVCITVRSLLHQTQCVYCPSVPITPDKMCVLF